MEYKKKESKILSEMQEKIWLWKGRINMTHTNKHTINDKISQSIDDDITNLMETLHRQHQYTIMIACLSMCKDTYSKHDHYIKQAKYSLNYEKRKN